MSTEKNMAIVRSLIEAENKHNTDLLDEFISPDLGTFDVDVSDTPKQTQGLVILKQMYTQMYNGFPDFHGTIEDITAEGDKVWIRFKGTGTHKGEYLGLAPTGKKVTMRAVSIYRIADEKVVEMWTVVDMLDIYKKIGVIEYTEKGKKLFPENV